MKLSKKIWLILIVAVVVAVNSWSAAAKNSLSLTNKKIAFKVTGARGQISLSYLQYGKIHPAVMLYLTIKGAKGKLSYTITQSSADQQSGTINLNSANHSVGSVQFTFGTPENYLKLTEFKNISSLKLDFKSAALVLPDQRHNDIVIYPGTWKKNIVSIPSDNHLVINMLDNGNAMLSCLWNKTTIQLHETKAGKSFSGLELHPKSSDTLWLGLNAAKNIWNIPSNTITTKAQQLDWQPPFPAIWHITIKKDKSKLAAECNQYDSWVLANFSIKPYWKISQTLGEGVGLLNHDGEAWTSGLGSYLYPFSLKQGKVLLNFPKYSSQRMTYNSKYNPLIYPVKLQSNSSTSQLLPYNALEKVLPAKSLAALSNIRSKSSHYPATCGITHKIEKIFYRDNAKQSRDIIKQYFKQMNLFVLNNRIRIDAYRKWSKQLIQQLNFYGKKHPTVTTLTKSLCKDLYQIQLHYAAVRDKIKTPKYCKLLTNKVEQLIDSNQDAEAKEDACKELGRQIRVIGGKQDHLLADMHYIVKALRMRVTLMLLENPPPVQRQILEKIGHATAQIMHTRFPMEGK